MRTWRIRALAAVTGMVALASGVASGSVFMPVSDQQLVCESLDIVRGTVLSTQSAWEGDPQAIWTHAVLEVDHAIRGEHQRGDLIDLKELGGTVDDYTIVAEQFPSFTEGDSVIVMLAPWEDGSGEMRVWGFGRGMFKLTKQHGRPDEAQRYDLVESKQATMHIDKLQPLMDADDLVLSMRELSARCPNGNGGGR